MGKYDFVVPTAMACGVQQRFHKIKQKPGKPFSLDPGAINSFLDFQAILQADSHAFMKYVLPTVKKLLHKQHGIVSKVATVTHDYSKPIGLMHLLKAWFNDGRITPLHAQESFRLHSFAQANSLIVLPEESEGCTSGDAVEVHLLPL